MRKIKQFFKNFFKIINSFEDVKNISRRMFITNSFDSIFASLGILIGGFQPNINPLILGMSILGGSLTMGVFSNIIAVYLAERSERLNELKKLERELMASLNDSIYKKSINFLSLYVSLWSGTGSFVFTSLISIPFFISKAFNFNILYSLIMSLIIAFSELIYLGYFMAKLNKENMALNILKNVVLGLLAISFILLIKYLFKI